MIYPTHRPMEISELQTRLGIEDNSKIIFLISQQKHIRLGDTVLMMSHKICFYGEISLISAKVFLLSLLSLVLSKLPVPGRPTIRIIVGQGPIALAVGAGGGCLDVFILLYLLYSLSSSLWETA